LKLGIILDEDNNAPGSSGKQEVVDAMEETDD